MSLTHAELVTAACKWLQNTRKLSVVIGDFRCVMVNEHPDAIGWRADGWSVLVECKTSRADFRVDKHKIARRLPEMGMGQERFFLAPDGIIDPDELPSGWGLLTITGRRVGIVRQSFNDGENARSRTWRSERQTQEMRMLLSAMRLGNVPMYVRPVKPWTKTTEQLQHEAARKVGT